MASNLTSGTFRIIPLIEGNPPIGVNFTRPAGQTVYLNGPVTMWRVKKIGDNTYHLSVGGYDSTGVLENKVTATIYYEQTTEWVITHQIRQSAYTISPVNEEGQGWTVADADSPDAEIELRPIIATLSEPPLFLPTQLFRFVPVVPDE